MFHYLMERRFSKCYTCEMIQITKNNLHSLVIKTENGCWEWIGAKHIGGYGTHNGETTHRIVWKLFNGEFPDLPGHHGAVVRHKCDNPPCVNPDHLLIGTIRDNINDMLVRGRSTVLKGTKALTQEQADEVKKLKLQGATYQEIADKFDMAVGSIHEIVNGRNKDEKSAEPHRKYRSLMTKKIPNKSDRKYMSELVGVSRNVKSGKWIAAIKGEYLGCFVDELGAAVAYDQASIAIRGPDAKTNAKLNLYFGPPLPEDYDPFK